MLCCLKQSVHRLRNHRRGHDQEHHPAIRDANKKALTDQCDACDLNPLDQLLASEDQVWRNHTGKDQQAQQQADRDNQGTERRCRHSTGRPCRAPSNNQEKEHCLGRRNVDVLVAEISETLIGDRER